MKMENIDKLNLAFVMMTLLNFILAAIVAINHPYVGLFGWAASLVNCAICGGDNGSAKSV